MERIRKVFLCVCYLLTVLTTPIMATMSDEIQAVHTVHEAWKEAFEDADINTIEKFWSHGKDALLITVLGNRHKSWAEVKAALKNMFGLLGKTTLDISEKFLTVDGNKASITMRYQWSPAEGMVFRSTEHYRKVNDEWKLHATDSQGNLLPLRPDDEKAIKRLASKVRDGFLAKDIAAIAEAVAADFTYIDRNGERIDGWDASSEILDALITQVVDIELQLMALMENQACGRYTLTQANGDTRGIRFTFAGPKWNLGSINLNTDVESLAVVQPKGKQIQYVLKKRKNLNQSTLSKLARIDRSRLAKIIHQEVTPSMAELERIARALCVKVSFLIGERDEKEAAHTPLNPDLVRLLSNQSLAINFRRLGKLDEEAQQTIARVIEGFVKTNREDAAKVR